MTDPDAPDADAPPDPDAPTAGAGGRSAAVRWVAAGVAFFLAVAAVAFALSSRQQLADERDGREQVERVSGQLAAALLTYDYRELDEWKERVLVNATGKFRREFEETFASSLEPIVTEVKATSRATVTDVYVGPIDDGAASAIVVANAIAEGTAGRRTTLASYIQLDLVEVDGRWRVDGVTNLNLGQGDGNAGPPTSVQGTNE
ncbi:MAG TPA: hypothetical protein VF230_09510 [Acidimicrobiales bacterium]